MFLLFGGMGGRLWGGAWAAAWEWALRGGRKILRPYKWKSGYRGYRRYRRYRLYRGCGLLGLWALGEDLGVEVRGEDGCYCFFEGGYF